jgi:arylsulfatase A-like enzyme
MLKNIIRYCYFITPGYLSIEKNASFYLESSGLSGSLSRITTKTQRHEGSPRDPIAIKNPDDGIDSQSFILKQSQCNFTIRSAGLCEKLVPLFLALLLAGISGCTENSSRNDRSASVDHRSPNIIYIIADDLGYGDIGAFGGEHIQTPNIDRLAAEGIRFTDHYSGSTVCAPARSVLMTGLHTGHTPIRGNREILPIGQYPLPEGTVTMPGILQKAGYKTGAFGKWGLGGPGTVGRPALHGFDTFFGYLGQRRAHFYYPEFLFIDVKGQATERVYLEGNEVIDDPERRPGSGRPVSAVQYAPAVIHQRALAFIEENSDNPFFLYIPSQIPHASLELPAEHLSPYVDESGESIFDEEFIPQNHYVDQPMPKAYYAAMVSYLDMQVGEIMAKLKELGIEDDTLIFFTSDNGSYSEGGYHYTMLDSNKPLRGGKRDLYEGGIRVPAIAWWPGVVEAGQSSSHISGFQDMMPTFAELADAEAPQDIDGISMVPILTGGGNQKQHEYLYWEFHGQGGKQAVRKGDWKAVRLNVSKDRDSSIELYNLAEDPGEQNEVSSKYPHIVKEMEQIMDEAHAPSEIFELF